MRYIAKTQVVHRGNGKTYEKGDVVPLDHLTDEEIQILIGVGGVEASADDIGISQVEAIKGLGAKYAQPLADNQIRTYAELANANADDLAGLVDVPVKTVRKWQADARKANEPATE